MHSKSISNIYIHKEQNMGTKALLTERERLIILLLFYKNEEHDLEVFRKSIELVNAELESKNRYNKNLQYEMLIKKVISNNTAENRDRLKAKFLELKRNKI